ncbi:MAG: SUMF1/EgtB/PvdO family nonheme iron enzyme [Oceanospirillales bacterium]|nr:SUMF1/EgtB/PvdO family nonheme iron enzyme [Oceanospirillales bacterium]
MDSANVKPLDLLKPEQVIGPDHHRFRLTAPLSSHPLGQLWQADDISTTKPTPVTLLFLSEALQNQSGFVDKLRDTLNRNRSIKDSFAARCYGLFTWRGIFFSSWEVLDGLTLAQMLEDGRAYKMKEAQKRGLIVQVGKALQAQLKQTSQPHATLAPELIYLNRSNGVRLMGYQWRALFGSLDGNVDHGAHYIGWQSAEAFHPNPLDASEDVFALASMIYQLYAGKAPFTPPESEESRNGKELKPPSGLTRDQWKTLQTALSDDPEQRPESPMELLRQLYSEKTEESSAKLDETKVEPEAEHPADSPQTARPSRIKLSSKWIKPVVGGSALFVTGVILGYWLARTYATDSRTVTETDATLAQLQQENRSLREQLQTNTEPLQTTAEAEPDLRTEPEERNALARPEKPTSVVQDGAALHNAEKPADNLSAFRDQWAPDRFAPQMVVIPKGRFRMGDLHGAGDDNEYPVHEVIISKAFAFSRFEVTFAEYDQFAQATGRPLPDDEGWGRDNQPVVNVSWQDAKAYTRWLAEQSGQPYRLPSEAEWEYVARAGTETKYWWGDELSQKMAVCDGCGTQWDGDRPAPVGSFPANPWGIHDLNGNVDEWVEDCYNGTYDGAPTDGSARTGNSCSHRVMRGGSWFEIPRLIRSASRYRHPANTSRNSWGFRVALDLPITE